MQCPHCSAQIQANDSFCAKCGKPVNGKKPKQSRMPWWISLLAVVVTIAAIITGITVYFSGSGNEAIEGQLQTIKQNRLTQAYYNYTSKEFQKETNLADFRKWVLSHPLLRSFKVYTLQEMETSETNSRVAVILENPSKGSLKLAYDLIQEDGKWKINSLKVTRENQDPSQEGPENIEDGEVDPQALVDLLKNHIQTLKSGNIKSAYEDFVTSDFRAKTSLKDFEEFVSKYPVFIKHKGAKIYAPTLHDGQGTMRVELRDEREKTIMDYTIRQGPNGLKIVGMRLVQAPPPAISEGKGAPVEDTFDSKPLFDTIMGQLADLKKGDIQRAYEVYTSKEFREATSFQNFEQFLESYPVFMDNSKTDFNKLTFNNNVGTYGGIFIGKDGKVYEVEYDLVLENRRWKILHMQINEASKKDGREASIEKNGVEPSGPMALYNLQ